MHSDTTRSVDLVFGLVLFCTFLGFGAGVFFVLQNYVVMGIFLAGSAAVWLSVRQRLNA